MKRTIVFAGVALTALAFNGCSNEAALKEAQEKHTARVKAVTDSLGSVLSTKEADLTTCQAEAQGLRDTLVVREAALEAALTKKTGTTAPKKPTTSTPPPAPPQKKVTSR